MIDENETSGVGKSLGTLSQKKSLKRNRTVGVLFATSENEVQLDQSVGGGLCEAPITKGIQGGKAGNSFFEDYSAGGGLLKPQNQKGNIVISPECNYSGSSVGGGLLKSNNTKGDQVSCNLKLS